MNSKKKRITLKPIRPNALFRKWLKELHQEAQENNSKIEPILKKALDSIKKFPTTLPTGKACGVLKDFPKKLCIFLDQRLDIYKSQRKHNKSRRVVHVKKVSRSSNKSCRRSTHNKSSESEKNISQSDSDEVQNVDCIDDVQPSSSLASDAIPTDTKISRKKNDRKRYKPALRSGGYAILVALLEHSKSDPHKKCLNKAELIKLAQKHSEESFTRSKPESFYTAWSSMSRLISKGLVEKTGNKKVTYSLTDQGVIIAEELLQENAAKPSVNDVIFKDSPVEIVDEINIKNKPVINVQTNTTDNNYFEMPAGTYNVILVIDKNETSGPSKKDDPTVAEFNKYPDLMHEYRSLKVGDFTWIAQDKTDKGHELVLPYIIERKRMDDLGASIKDGRFHEQKFRLRKCGLKNVIYMIENYGKNKHVGLPLQTLTQALANTRVQDGFKIHWTDSLKNSARFLAMMTKRLTIEFKNKNLKGADRETSNDELMTFKFFNMSSMKTKALTVTETFIKVLLQLKGVSVEKALAITSEYRTPKSLIDAYQKCDGDSGMLLLANLKYGCKPRNVGPKVSKSIYHLFQSRQ